MSCCEVDIVGATASGTERLPDLAAAGGAAGAMGAIGGAREAGMIGVAEVSFAGAGALAVWFAVWGRGFGNGTVTAKATHGDATIAAARKPRAIRLVMFDDAAKTLPAIRISKPG
jgi:hypothetical protein